MSTESQSKYALVPVGNRFAEWDETVRDSRQGTIFSLSEYLAAAGCPYRLFFVVRGREIKAGVSLVLSEDARRCVIDDLVIYNGLLFRSNPLQRSVRARMERFEIAEFVLAELDGMFDVVEMALHPGIEDIRPFLWHNYGSSKAPRRYRANTRYTSFLDISEFFLRRPEEAMALYAEIDNVRQRDIRRARTEGVRVAEGTGVDLFIQYYASLMASAGATVPPEKLDRMSRLVDTLLAKGLAKLFETVNRSGKVTYITVFTLFENHACYLFGAGDASLMARHDGTICLWEAFRQLADTGIREVDMEGVNSPHRGWFKLGFGGDLRPYFEVSNAEPR